MSKWPLFWALAGALPLLTAHFWYKIGLLAYSQIGLVRTLGLLGVFGLFFVAIAALGALAAGFLPRGPRLTRTVQLGFLLLASANMASLGLSVFYWAPSLAPRPWQLGAAALLAVLAVTFWRYSEAERRFTTLALSRFGLLLLAVPALAAPWVITGALAHSERIAGAPSLPARADALPHAPRRIVLVTFDALPTWATSLAHPEGDTTPTLARLAAESTEFTNYRSASDGTLVGLTTTLTGVSASTIQPQLHNRLAFLPYGAVTGLAGYLKQAGYKGLFATMIAHPSALGLADEFDHGIFNCRAFFATQFHSRSYLPVREAATYWLTTMLHMKTHDTAEAWISDPPAAVVDTFSRGLAMLERERGPVFLWIHIGAPHAPYVDLPVRPADGRLAPGRRVAEAEIERANREKDAAAAADFKRIFERYVRFADGELGHFVDGLSRSPAWPETLLVVTADHGEAFTPGHIGHGSGTLKERVDHVPLLIHEPGQHQAARRDEAVGQIDLVPTLLARTLGEVPAGLPGRPLLAGQPGDRVFFTYGGMTDAHSTSYYPLTMAAYREPYTYVADFTKGHESEALYDHRKDPGELHDIAAEQPEVTTRLREAVRKERAKFAPPAL